MSWVYASARLLGKQESIVKLKICFEATVKDANKWASLSSAQQNMCLYFFFFNHPAPPEISPLSPHTSLPICRSPRRRCRSSPNPPADRPHRREWPPPFPRRSPPRSRAPPPRREGS